MKIKIIPNEFVFHAEGSFPSSASSLVSVILLRRHQLDESAVTEIIGAAITESETASACWGTESESDSAS